MKLVFEGNHPIAKHIAQTTIESAKDDLNIIDNLYVHQNKNFLT
ncbi:MAG: hypothetical protein ABF991_11865 [Liquorilactobacillus hordei]